MPEGDARSKAEGRRQPNSAIKPTHLAEGDVRGNECHQGATPSWDGRATPGAMPEGDARTNAGSDARGHVGGKPEGEAKK